MRPGLPPSAHQAVRPLVVTAFIRLARNGTKHGYTFEHALRVPAPYWAYCGVPDCQLIKEARARQQLATTTRGPPSAAEAFDAVLELTARRLNVETAELVRAAERSVHRAPWGGHCPSWQLVVVWLAKPFLVEMAIAEQEEHQRERQQELQARPQEEQQAQQQARQRQWQGRLQQAYEGQQRRWRQRGPPPLPRAASSWYAWVDAGFAYIHTGMPG